MKSRISTILIIVLSGSSLQAQNDTNFPSASLTFEQTHSQSNAQPEMQPERHMPSYGQPMPDPGKIDPRAETPEHVAYALKYPDTLAPTSEEQAGFYLNNVVFGVGGTSPIKHHLDSAVKIPYGTLVPRWERFPGHNGLSINQATKYIPDKNDAVKETLRYTNTLDTDVLKIIHDNPGKRILLAWSDGTNGYSDPDVKCEIQATQQWAQWFDTKVQALGDPNAAVQWGPEPDTKWLGHIRAVTQLPGQSRWELNDSTQDIRGGRLDAISLKRIEPWFESKGGSPEFLHHHWSELYSLDPVISAEYALRDGKDAGAGTLYRWAQGRYDVVIVVHPELALPFHSKPIVLPGDTQVMLAYAMRRECEALAVCSLGRFQSLEAPYVSFIATGNDPPVPVFTNSLLVTGMPVPKAEDNWQDAGEEKENETMPLYTPAPLQIINLVHGDPNAPVTSSTRQGPRP